MVLSDEHIRRFQELYKSHFGREISKEDAYEQGIKLVCLLKLVYKPITKEDYENYLKEGSKKILANNSNG